MKILDACCGGKMFWYNKHEPHTTYMDIREGNYTITNQKTTKKVIVDPDIIADFRDMPFPDNHFDMVLFDPPHLIWAGPNSYMKAQYGKLPKDWRLYLKKGFDECMRVLKPSGTLIFKWSDVQIKMRDVLNVIGYQPIFGDKRSTTRWVVFIKQQPTSLDPHNYNLEQETAHANN